MSKSVAFFHCFWVGGVFSFLLLSFVMILMCGITQATVVFYLFCFIWFFPGFIIIGWIHNKFFSFSEEEATRVIAKVYPRGHLKCAAEERLKGCDESTIWHRILDDEIKWVQRTQNFFSPLLVILSWLASPSTSD